MAPRDQDPRSQSWHVKKEIQAGHLLTTIALVMGMVGAYYRMAERITVNEIEMRQQKEFLQSQDAVALATIAQLRAQLDKIEAKLDRLIETGGKR